MTDKTEQHAKTVEALLDAVSEEFDLVHVHAEDAESILERLMETHPGFKKAVEEFATILGEHFPEAGA